jgi:hypothetical protein
MDVGEAGEQIVSGAFGFVEFAGADEVGRGVGGLGQFVGVVVTDLEIPGEPRPAWRRCGCVGGACGRGGGLVAGEAALLVEVIA